MISVVIPCYNQGRFLGEAIESVRAQTVGESEIIVVDDGSTDDTADVARRHGVPCMWQRNQGQGAARNEGLRRARGDFIVFLDSDDRLLPRAFEIGLGYLAEHPHRAFAAGRCLVFDTDGVRTNIWYSPAIERDHYLHLLMCNFAWMPGSVMFRTSAVRAVGGFKTGVSGAEDYDLYLRLTHRYPVVCHEHFVAEYRQHGTSTSRRPALMLRSTLRVMREQRPFVAGNARAEHAWRVGVKHWQGEYGEETVRAIRNQLRAGDRRGLAPAMLALLRDYPHGIVHHVVRKLWRVVRRRKPEALNDSPAERLELR